MKKWLLVFLSLSFVFWPGMSPAQDSWGVLGFKGINLGMSYKEINSVLELNQEKWSHWYKSDFKFNPQEKDNHLAYKDPKGIGCRGTKEKQTCFGVNWVMINFLRGRVSSIEIYSTPYRADRIEAGLKEWTAFARLGLVNKYGPPTNIFKTIDSLNIFSFKSGFLLYLCEWVKNQKSVSLGILEDGAYYWSVIGFSDLRALRDESQKSKTKHEF